MDLKHLSMYDLKKRLINLTSDLLRYDDPETDTYRSLSAQAECVKELLKVWKLYEALKFELPNSDVKKKLDMYTVLVIKLKYEIEEDVKLITENIKAVGDVIKLWQGLDAVEIDLDLPGAQREEERRSTKTWDGELTDEGWTEGNADFTTDIKITDKQAEFLGFVDSEVFNKFLAMGGSGSGKSFIEAYITVRDALRYKAPCLIARYALIDLEQGMRDQILPAVLSLIAKANGVDDWRKWKIDGLQFAKWTDKRTVLQFATGGYIRIAGLGARDNSESGSDKILSPSWFHIMLEEISELNYDIVEKLITRLRYQVKGVRNKLLMCENPPSINHWSYKRYVEFKREDGSKISETERRNMLSMVLNPKDNVENLGDDYIQELSQMTGDNYERFYLGKFQDSATGLILKKVRYVDELPPHYDWDRLCVYCDPTPLVTKDHSVYADFKASVLVGLWDGEFYVLDIRLVRGSTTDMLISIKQLYDVSPNPMITEVFMENNGVPSDFKKMWETFSMMHNFHIPIQRDKRKFGDKKAAIETYLQPEFEAERVFFNAKLKGTERGIQMEHQILKFSRKSNKFVHDDVPDALMKAITILNGKKLKRWDTSGFSGKSSIVRPSFVRIGG